MFPCFWEQLIWGQMAQVRAVGWKLRGRKSPWRWRRTAPPPNRSLHGNTRQLTGDGERRLQGRIQDPVHILGAGADLRFLSAAIGPANFGVHAGAGAPHACVRCRSSRDDVIVRAAALPALSWTPTPHT